jgi:hypothetical protein
MLQVIMELRETARKSPDLLKFPPKTIPEIKALYGKINGHCYIVCEALCHIFPGYFSVYNMKVDKTTHWFLEYHDNYVKSFIVDPTSDQFDFELDYKCGKASGFLTKTPCKRTVELIKRTKNLKFLKSLWENMNN